MGALLGVAVQLTMLAIGLLITLVVGTIRLTAMLCAALIRAAASLGRG